MSAVQPSGAQSFYPPTGESSVPVEITDYRIYRRANYSRIVLTLSGSIRYEIASWKTSPIFYIDLRNVHIAPYVQKTLVPNDGRIEESHITLYGRNARLFVRAEGQLPLKIRIRTYRAAPFRIFVDVVRPSRKAQSVPRPPAVTPPLAEQPQAAPPQAEPPLTESPTTEQPPSREPDWLRFSGYLRNETAYRIRKPDEFSKFRNLLLLAGEGQLREDVSYRVSGRFHYDGVYDLTRQYPAAVRADERWEHDLRDAYLDVSEGNWDLRLGHQQIVWGEVLGLSVADVVNPKDYREFILPSFEYMRIPQWASSVEYTAGNFHAQAIWLPINEFDRYGLPGSEFAPPIPLPADRGAVFPASVHEPGDSLQNSEAGGRLSLLAEGWDMSAFHLYTWDRTPVLFRTIAPAAAFPVYVFDPQYRRVDISGATISKEVVDGVILKGEMTYRPGQYFSVLDETNPNGTTRKDFWNYAVDADHTFFGKIDSSAQVMQQIISKYEPTIFEQKRVTTYGAVWLKTGFFNNRLEPEVLWMGDVQRENMMIRPKLTYQTTSHWKLRAGVDLFRGSPDGLFGFYSGKSRTYGEVQFDF